MDVIGDGGSTWYKAVARKAEAISQICKGKTSSSQKSVIEQAKCYLKCAEEHPHHFRAPRVNEESQISRKNVRLNLICFR